MFHWKQLPVLFEYVQMREVRLNQNIEVWGPEKELKEATLLGTARNKGEVQNQRISLTSYEIVFSIVNLKI